MSSFQEKLGVRNFSNDERLKGDRLLKKDTPFRENGQTPKLLEKARRGGKEKGDK